MLPLRPILMAAVMLTAGSPGSLSGQPFGEPAPEPFESTVRLVFKTHCLHCHGGDGVVEGGLDLRLGRLIVEGGDSGPAVQLGDADAINLVARMVDGEMPLEEVTIHPSAEQRFDCLITDGHVIDPRNKIDAILDVAIRDGRVGTSGWRNFPDFTRRIIDHSQTRMLAWLNIVGAAWWT